MKTVLKSALIVLALAFFSSCQDTVQIDLDQGSKLYVIDAFVNDLRTPQVIRVTTNDNYFSTTAAPPVNGAVVILKDLTSNTQYNFSDAGNGNYVFTLNSTDTLARLDHQYELNVTIDGKLYSSLGIQKRTAKIDSIHADYRDGEGGFGPPRDPFYRCSLWALDKVDANTDYYWVKTYRNDTLFLGANDINVCIDGTGAAVKTANSEYINFTPPVTFLGFHEYQTGDVCRVEVHSVSADTYNFLLQSLNQISNSGLFATTPENVKTNIISPAGATKAVGWFNMAKVTSLTKVIP